VETIVMVMGGVFTVGMLILLPKYAKFIHRQPKMHLEKKRQETEEQNLAPNREQPAQDG
jgi:hypothetical protein